jgi:hypothetical protein
MKEHTASTSFFGLGRRKLEIPVPCSVTTLQDQANSHIQLNFRHTSKQTPLQLSTDHQIDGVNAALIKEINFT